VRYAIDAAQAAGRALAWEEEIEHYGAALRALDEDASDDDATRCRILLAMASAQVTLGDLNPKPAYARVAAIAKRHRWGHVLASAAVGSARVFEYGVVDRDAIALLEDALVLLGDEDGPERARVLGRLAETLYHLPGSVARRDTLSREALEVAYSGRIPLLMELGDIGAASADIETLARLVADLRLGGSYNDMETARFRATQAMLAGRLDDSERLARTAHNGYARIGDPDAERIFTAQLLPIRLEQERGGELVQPISALSQRLPDLSIWRCALCLLHARVGRADEARAELRTLGEKSLRGRGPEQRLAGRSHSPGRGLRRPWRARARGHARAAPPSVRRPQRPDPPWHRCARPDCQGARPTRRQPRALGRGAG
jgi:hypothetical protein